MDRLYTEDEVAAILNRKRRWLLEWLCNNPEDQWGKPFCLRFGRSKRFSDNDIVRLVRTLFAQEKEAKTRGKPAQDEPGWVYFADNGSHIKIGFTRTATSLRSRKKQLGTHAPNGVEILYLEAGDGEAEKALHRKFAEFRVRGEWFRKAPELLEYIEQRKQVAA